MAKKIRTCVACGTNYTYCPRCDADASKPRWMFAFHNENCKNLDHIATDFLAGEISEDEAKSRFELCDLSYRDSLHEAIKAALNMVFPEKRAFKKSESTDDTMTNLLKSK